MTHNALCELARRWLFGAGDCRVVFIECGACTEMPDALGFRGAWGTALIEVKVTRSDFFADRKKPFRIEPASGMGRLRYFLTPAGLVKPGELPAGWGLIWAYPSGITRVQHRPEPFEHRNQQGEQMLLYAAAQRVTLRGFWHLVEHGWTDPTDPDPRPATEPLWDTSAAVTP